MKIFEAFVSDTVVGFLRQQVTSSSCLTEVNQILLTACGIVDFILTDAELNELKNTLLSEFAHAEKHDRAEYGDFQTNDSLSTQIIDKIKAEGISPQIIIEPTCGKGSFIISALKRFNDIEFIYGIEIYKPYVWETKFNVLNFFIENKSFRKPQIAIILHDVFDFDFKEITLRHIDKRFLIVGNPPWITNSALGSLNSLNLPQKSNFKDHTGIDAITGKGNFDIAEYITLIMIDTFANKEAYLAFLVKNSVIKNIVFDQKRACKAISNLKKYNIDSKKEFNVSVEAALLTFKLTADVGLSCDEYDFYENKTILKSFGWVDNKFVSNMDTYFETKEIDGQSQFEWRQGLKHDCSMIMEFEKINNVYINGLNNRIEMEDELVYGLLKSSDLKSLVINNTRKYTIVTQKKVGQETNYIGYSYPQTHRYLKENQNFFNNRKSIIYQGKPLYSIFGIGDYSFKPYKVAISGLYKTFHFALILPQDNKPIMLDDTCYLLGFDRLEFAAYTSVLLNNAFNREFLKSITFKDSKRTFTKEVLMRIDLLALSKCLTDEALISEIKKLNREFGLQISYLYWAEYKKVLTPLESKQIKVFA